MIDVIVYRAATDSTVKLVDLGVDMGNNGSAHQRMPSSIRYKQRESTASLPKQPKPDHHEIERRFNQVLVTRSILFIRF